MKQGKTKQIIGLTCWTALYLAAAAYAPVGQAREETPPTVSVGVHAQHAGDKIVYYYRVTNNTQQNVAAVSIGRDNRDDGNPANDIYELLERPSGWNLKFGVPTTSYNAPTGWRVSMATPDEEDPDKEGQEKVTPDKATPDKVTMAHAVTWEPLNEKSPKLFAGQSMSKLSITLDKADTNYLTGHAFITFTEGSLTSLSVPLQRLDNTPPTLTVNLSPNTLLSQNNKDSSPELGLRAAAIKASFTIQDDYDHMPQIKLESITANEPVEAGDILDASLGLDDRYFKLRPVRMGETDRVYTVIYSATDASGNQTLASATVTVMIAATEPAPTTETTPAPAGTPAMAPATVPPGTSPPR